MKIYISGGFPYFTPEEIDNFLTIGIKRRLFSYPFILGDEKIRTGFEHICNTYPNYDIMMDSGAYSVYSKGIKIDIDKYAEFLLKYKNNITTPINLDVILDTMIPNEIENGAQQGWENLKYLESKGLEVLHTFHSGEDEKWLYKLMDEYEYFGISRTAFLTGWKQRLDKHFEKLVDKTGKPLWKIHGFGIASPEMMIKYPFYSVDTASWIKYGVYGMAILFKNQKMKTIGISDRKLTLWAVKGQHYNNLNRMERKVWDEEMEKRGISKENLQDNRIRDMWNIQSFLELEKYLTENPTTFNSRKRSIFSI